jgi:hypothetical protein
MIYTTARYPVHPYRRTAGYVDRIFKGTNTSALTVQRRRGHRVRCHIPDARLNVRFWG